MRYFFNSQGLAERYLVKAVIRSHQLLHHFKTIVQSAQYCIHTYYGKDKHNTQHLLKPKYTYYLFIFISCKIFFSLNSVSYKNCLLFVEI